MSGSRGNSARRKQRKLEEVEKKAAELKTDGWCQPYSFFMSTNESDCIVISDYLYVTPQTVEIWEKLSEEEKQHHINEAEYFSEEYNDGEPLSFADVQGAELRGA